MEYRLAIDPDLGLSPQDFVETWNASFENKQTATAQLVEQSSGQYDPLAVETARVILESMALSLLSSAIYDLIKEVFIRKGIQRQIHIQELVRPDGTRLLTVSLEEVEED